MDKQRPSLDFFAILQLNYVAGLLAASAFYDLVANSLTLFQSLEAFSLDSGEMYEYVLAALCGNEAVALLRIKPLNCTLIHFGTLHIKNFGFCVHKKIHIFSQTSGKKIISENT